MEKLSMVSRRLQVFVIVCMVLTLIGLVVTVLTEGWAAALKLPSNILVNESNIKGANVLVLIVLVSMTMVSQLVAYWFVYKLFGPYKQGIIFTKANVTAMRYIGWALIAIDVVHMIKIVIMGPILTSLEITSPFVSAGIQVTFLIVGLFIVLVSLVIDMGRELKEQDSLVI